MSEEVFEGTPLSGYLNATQTAEDWGIEGSSDSEGELNIVNGDNQFDYSDSRSANNQHGMNTSTSAARYDVYSESNKSLRPLALKKGSSFTKKEQFRQTLRAILGQEVSSQETLRFLDQFRYIIVSSSLLEPHPLYNVWSAPTDLRRRRLLFDTRKPWVHLYIQPVFKATEKGSIIALCLLLHHKYRSSPEKSERVTVALIITVVIIIYMFATSRRRLLRSLRERALVYMEMFSQSAKYFDGDCVRALRELQDLDFVSNGFTPGSRSNFLIANNHGSGKKLRAVLSSSLHLLKESYLQALKDCIGMSPRMSLDQFIEIYDLKERMLENGFVISGSYIGFTEPHSKHALLGAEACYVPVRDLKKELEKVQLVRRILLCCLLAAESSGKTTIDELERWTTICDNLTNNNNLTEQFSNLISCERLQPALTHSQNEHILQTQKSQSKLNGVLIDVLTRAKYVAARLDIVHDSELAHNELQSHIALVERDIEELGHTWKNYLALKAKEDKQEPVPEQYEVSDNFDPTAPSPTLIMTPDSSEMSTFSTLNPPELSDITSNVTADDTFNQMSILEGESSSFIIPKSGLSREERIILAKRDRKLSGQAAGSASSRKGSLILELNNVLNQSAYRHQA